LAHVGRTDEAKVLAYRALSEFASLCIKPAEFIATFGAGMLELYSGNLGRAIELANRAASLAGNAQREADCLALCAFAMDLSGDRAGASARLDEANARSKSLSLRVLYCKWLSMIHHATDFCDVDRYFEGQAKCEPAPDKAAKHFDWRTTLRAVRLHLAYRRALAEDMDPYEYYDLVNTVYADFPQQRYNPFHHRTVMQLHKARALGLCATAPNASSNYLNLALAAYDTVDRFVITGNYRLLSVDAQIAKARMFRSLADPRSESLLDKALDNAKQLGYAWGEEEVRSLRS
jgi:hypothetical protein